MLLNQESYCELITCVLAGRLNEDAFEQAWQAVVNRYAVLRTSFVYKNLDRMLQVVQKEISLPIIKRDWQGKSIEQQSIELQLLFDQEREKGFELTKAPLMRLI